MPGILTKKKSVKHGGYLFFIVPNIEFTYVKEVETDGWFKKACCIVCVKHFGKQQKALEFGSNNKGQTIVVTAFLIE